MKTHAHFVRYPDLFPARIGGEACGEIALTIDFSGGPYRFRGLSPAQRAAIEPAFGALITDATTGAVDVSIFRAAETDFLPAVFDLGIYELAFTYESTSISVSGPSFMGRVDLSAGMRAGIWTSAENDADFPIVFENFFRLVVANRLLQRRGVLLHSAGVVADGKATLLFGPSGAGKSTAARLSRDAGYTILSDDLNAVSLEGGVLCVSQVPFAGDLGRVSTTCARLPLHKIYRLKQAPAHAASTLTAAEGVAMLVAAAPFVNLDPHRSDLLLEVIFDIVQQKPVEVLSFAKDAGFMHVVGAP